MRVDDPDDTVKNDRPSDRGCHYHHEGGHRYRCDNGGDGIAVSIGTMSSLWFDFQMQEWDGVNIKIDAFGSQSHAHFGVLSQAYGYHS